MSYVCKRCAVYFLGEDRKLITFTTIDEAEQHVLDKHPTRLLDSWRGLVAGLDSREREAHVEFMLRDHNAR